MKIHFDEIFEILEGLFFIIIAFLVWLGVYIVILNYVFDKLYSFFIYVSIFIVLFYCTKLLNLKFKNRLMFLMSYGVFAFLV